MLPNDHPLVAIDVSKGKSHAQTFVSRGHPCAKAFCFDHTKTGLAKLAAAVSGLTTMSGKKPAIAYEHTGVYSRVIAGWAESSGLASIPIPPLLSAKARKAKLRPTKTDAIDCQTIAEVAYAHDAGAWQVTSALLAISRMREAAVEAAATARGRYREQIDLSWPCLDKFIDPASSAAIAAVARYRHPSAVLRAGPKRVEAAIRKGGRCLGRLSAKAAAEALCSYAAESMSPVGEDSPETESLMMAIEALESAAEAEGRLTSEMIAEARKSDGFAILMSIDGIAERLAASILAELGDPSRFRGKGSVAAYAGLDPAVSQSGKSEGKHLGITRKGNARLRKYLYLATVGCCSPGKSNRIKRFVEKKQKGGLPRKAALVAGCRKMIVVIRSMLLNGTLFEH